MDRVALAVPVFAMVMAAAAGAVPPPARAGLTDGVIRAGTDVSDFRKWSGMMRRFADQKRRAGNCTAAAVPCPAEDWRAAIDRFRRMRPADQLAAVNDWINARPYREDRAAWGVRDHWATPYEFLRRSGDCEDFAIAKYMLLGALGVPSSAMRVLVVHDRMRDLPHAVLAVDTRAGRMILDNQEPDVLPASAVQRYRPLYAISESGWWQYAAVAD